MRQRRRQRGKVVFPLSAMIDCTFLLLIYFMAACTMHKQEADISFSLPGRAEQSEALVMPDEQIIEIRSDGTLILNDRELDAPGSSDVPELVETLNRFREMCRAAKNEPMLTIQADDTLPHQRVVEVLNACAAARVQLVTFAIGEQEGY